MTRARLGFVTGDPIDFELDDVVAYGPEPISGFSAWLGAVQASADGRWVVRFDDDRILGFTRTELKRIRLTPTGVEFTLGEQTVPVKESEVVSFGPEPTGVRAWLGRLAHGRGDAWIRLRDGRELRFAIGDGPHVSFRDPAAPR